MAPPTNTTALTAIVIPALPYATVQTVDDAGVTYTVWYAYTAQAGDVVLGVFGFGDLAVYRPSVKIYDGPAAAPVWYLFVGALNRKVQFPVTPGTTYFFEFSPNAGNPTPAVLTLTVERAPDVDGQPGDLFVPDDTDGFPAAVIDPVTGEVRQFVYPFPAGEAGDILPTSGRFLVENGFTGALKLYDASFALLATLFDGSFDTYEIRTCLGTEHFFVVNKGQLPAIVLAIDLNGTVLNTWALPGNGATGMAALNDESILLISGQGGSIGSPIKRFDFGTLAFLADFAAGVAGYQVFDILVLSDDTVIAGYHDPSVPRDLFVRHYSAAGAILDTYAFGTNQTSLRPRLAYAIDEPNSFWVWHHPATITPGFSIFDNVRVSDGAILTQVVIAEYEGGAYQPAETATPANPFGNSFSCPFFILRVASVPPCPDTLPSPCPAVGEAAIATGKLCTAPNPTGCPSWDAGG